MDEQTRARILTAFFSCKSRKGTGLGLLIANQIIKQHGGGIFSIEPPKLALPPQPTQLTPVPSLMPD
jgi:signal transduction histidine kinase